MNHIRRFTKKAYGGYGSLNYGGGGYSVSGGSSGSNGLYDAWESVTGSADKLHFAPIHDRVGDFLKWTGLLPSDPQFADSREADKYWTDKMLQLDTGKGTALGSDLMREAEAYWQGQNPNAAEGDFGDYMGSNEGKDLWENWVSGYMNTPVAMPEYIAQAKAKLQETYGEGTEAFMGTPQGQSDFDRMVQDIRGNASYSPSILTDFQSRKADDAVQRIKSLRDDVGVGLGSFVVPGGVLAQAGKGTLWGARALGAGKYIAQGSKLMAPAANLMTNYKTWSNPIARMGFGGVLGTSKFLAGEGLEDALASQVGNIPLFTQSPLRGGFTKGFGGGAKLLSGVGKTLGRSSYLAPLNIASAMGSGTAARHGDTARQWEKEFPLDEFKFTNPLTGMPSATGGEGFLSRTKFSPLDFTKQTWTETYPQALKQIGQSLGQSIGLLDKPTMTPDPYADLVKGVGKGGSKNQMGLILAIMAMLGGGALML